MLNGSTQDSPTLLLTELAYLSREELKFNVGRLKSKK